MVFDLFVFNFINGLSRKWWLLDWFGVFLADYLGYILIIAAFFLILKERKWSERIRWICFILLSIILARGIVAEALKFFIGRERPFSKLNFQPLINGANDVFMSFPSGHAAFYFALATSIFFLNKKVGWWFFGATGLMGIARIFSGVHWPSDIIAGALLGIGSGFLIKKLLFPRQIIGHKTN